jgi:hypothetical protein
MVVLELAVESPGVTIELQLLREHRKQQSTVIIIVEHEDEAALGAYNVLTSPTRPLTASSSELDDFPRIASHRSITYDTLRESPLLRDLLPRS